MQVLKSIPDLPDRNLGMGPSELLQQAPLGPLRTTGLMPAGEFDFCFCVCPPRKRTASWVRPARSAEGASSGNLTPPDEAAAQRLVALGGEQTALGLSWHEEGARDGLLHDHGWSALLGQCRLPLPCHLLLGVFW